MLVASPATKPMRNASRRVCACARASSSGTNAIQANGHREKSSHGAATSAPVATGSAIVRQRDVVTSEAKSLEGAAPAAPEDAAGWGKSETWAPTTRRLAGG